jgi:hypothetical protein
MAAARTQLQQQSMELNLLLHRQRCIPPEQGRLPQVQPLASPLLCKLRKQVAE